MDFSCTLATASASRALLSRVPLGKQPGPQDSQDDHSKKLDDKIGKNQKAEFGARRHQDS
jgi:hypothetical protein